MWENSAEGQLWSSRRAGLITRPFFPRTSYDHPHQAATSGPLSAVWGGNRVTWRSPPAYPPAMTSWLGRFRGRHPGETAYNSPGGRLCSKLSSLSWLIRYRELPIARKLVRGYRLEGAT